MDDPSERHLAPSLSERKTETATAIDAVARSNLIGRERASAGGILTAGASTLA